MCHAYPDAEAHGHGHPASYGNVYSPSNGDENPDAGYNPGCHFYSHSDSYSYRHSKS